jgi:septal ring-binding cell division protein DamX
LGGGNHVPFKSQAQRRKFAELLVKGEISADTFEEWNRETGGRKLPERVATARRSKKKTSAKATTTPARKRPVKKQAAKKKAGRRK